MSFEPLTRKAAPNLSKRTFERFDGSELTDDMLEKATQLFNDHYGIWGEDPTNNDSHHPKPGTRVKLSKNRIQAQNLPTEAASCSYARVTIDDCLAGNAFACRWRYRDEFVCWVTQLVVHRDFRKDGLATGLLSLLRRDDDAAYGIMSSHPAACLAAANAFGSGDGISAAPLDFIRNNAGAIMRASPVSYVKQAELRGSLFDPEDRSGAVSSVDTRFFVDHTEPLEALARVREVRSWPLGELLDGREFLLVVTSRRCERSRSRSGSGVGVAKLQCDGLPPPT